MSLAQEFYALSHDRSAKCVRAFLDAFLPTRASGHDDYPVPEKADEPTVVLDTEGQILEYLEAHPEEPYALYWNDKIPDSSRQAMVFYTRDGQAILGLAEVTEEPDERLKVFASSVGAEFSRLGWEARPPETAEAFIAECRKR